MSEPHSDSDGLGRALGWLDAGRRVAVATVTASWEGAPRRPGSLLALAEGGGVAGSVSDGCVEESVVRQGLRAIEDGEQRLLAYTIADDIARQAGLAGGGRIELYLEPVDPGTPGHRLLDRVARARAEGLAAALVTDLVTGLKTLVYPETVHGGFGLDGPVLAEIRACLADRRCAVLEPSEDSRLWVQVF